MCCILYLCFGLAWTGLVLMDQSSSTMMYLRDSNESLATPIDNSTKEPEPIARDCAEVELLQGHNESGVYTVHIDLEDGQHLPVNVYCDLETDNGGWLVFQRRTNGSLDFNRDWTSYYNGFGALSHEFWFGNAPLHRLSKHKSYTMRIDMTAADGESRHIHYRTFSLKGHRDDFALSLGDAVGNAGDSIGLSSSHAFSTPDRDNDDMTGTSDRYGHRTVDINCAEKKKGGWWYTNCGGANLNGVFYECGFTKTTLGELNADGIYWNKWNGYFSSMKFTEMKIRPKGYANPKKWTFGV